MRKQFISITSAGQAVGEHRRALRQLGLVPVSESMYKGVIRRYGEETRIREFCSENGLRFSYDNDFGKRSGNYREVFFRTHPPDAGKKYTCVYCGRKYPKEKITVDHLYPVSRVSQSIRLQKTLARRGIKSVNDPANLVAACASCNFKKGKKMRKWIIKGRIGRHKGVWVFRKTMRAVLILCVIVVLAYLIFPSVFPKGVHMAVDRTLADIGTWFTGLLRVGA